MHPEEAIPLADNAWVTPEDESLPPLITGLRCCIVILSKRDLTSIMKDFRKTDG